MSQHEAEIKQIEVSIEDCQKQVDKAATLRRLMENPDFQAIIEEDYFIQEPARMTTLLDSPNPAFSSPEKQGFILADLRAVAGLRRYFSTTLQMGMIAEDQILQHQQELDSLRADYTEEDPS